MKECLVCGSNAVIKLLDFGTQSICNRFLKSPKEQEYKHPLIVGLCKTCGLIQLINPFPATELRPSYDWITYREPEEHLDRLASILSKLPNLNKNSKICGISFKDDTLLERMKKLGFPKIIRLDPKKDLGIDDGWTGVETVQYKLDIERARSIVERYGKFDLLIVRHILEHAYDLLGFMRSIKALVSPEGYAMFEAPDWTKPLEHFDYSTIWEEHTVYFTPETFKNCFSFGGFSVEGFEIFPYSLENCLVAILKPVEVAKPSFPDKNLLQKENSRALAFSEEFPKKKAILKSFFSDYKKNKGKIAFFGAGHTASVFINIFELRDSIECVIDDNVHKQGLVMPGSHLSIIGSSGLLEKDIKLCILSLNPDIEEKIIKKNNIFVENGGTFLSIVPTSKHSLYSQLKISSSEDFPFKEFNKEVYYATDKVIKLGKKEIQMLKEKAMSNERKRCRICAHSDVNEELHEMFIVHTKDTYVRPHKHLNKCESMYIIEGSAKVVIFDETGNITGVIQMGDYSSGRRFYYRISDPYYHTLCITSEFLVFHETTKGPFKRKDTIFAPWSPEESDTPNVKKFLEQLAKSIELL